MIELALLVTMTFLFLLVVQERDLLKAVIYLAGSSFCLTMIFLILKAPDIALTQAAIEVILVTVIFVVTIEKTRRFEE
jgi:uncharacterized MnhB-related membrane protein